MSDSDLKALRDEIRCEKQRLAGLDDERDQVSRHIVTEHPKAAIEERLKSGHFE